MTINTEEPAVAEQQPDAAAPSNGSRKVAPNPAPETGTLAAVLAPGGGIIAVIVGCAIVHGAGLLPLLAILAATGGGAAAVSHVRHRRRLAMLRGPRSPGAPRSRRLQASGVAAAPGSRRARRGPGGASRATGAKPATPTARKTGMAAKPKPATASPRRPATPAATPRVSLAKTPRPASQRGHARPRPMVAAQRPAAKPASPAKRPVTTRRRVWPASMAKRGRPTPPRGGRTGGQPGRRVAKPRHLPRQPGGRRVATLRRRLGRGAGIAFGPSGIRARRRAVLRTARALRRAGHAADALRHHRARRARRVLAASHRRVAKLRRAAGRMGYRHRGPHWLRPLIHTAGHLITPLQVALAVACGEAWAWWKTRSTKPAPSRPAPAPPTTSGHPTPATATPGGPMAATVPGPTPNPADAIAEAFAQVASFHPHTVPDLTRFLDGIHEAFGAGGSSFTGLADHFDEEYPFESLVTEVLREMQSAFAQLAELASNVSNALRTAHEQQLAALESSKPEAGFFDVDRNRGA